MKEIIIKVNGENLDLSSQTSVRLRKQLIDLQNINSRFGSFTYSITLPLTSNNRRIIKITDDNVDYKFINVNEKNSQINRQPIIAVIISDGQEIIKGELKIREITKNNIIVNIINTPLGIFNKEGADRSIKDIVWKPTFSIAGWKGNNIDQDYNFDMVDEDDNQLNSEKIYINELQSINNNYLDKLYDPKDDTAVFVSTFPRGFNQQKIDWKKNFIDKATAYNLFNGTYLEALDYTKIGDNFENLHLQLVLQNQFDKDGKELFAMPKDVIWDGERIFWKYDGNKLNYTNGELVEPFNAKFDTNTPTYFIVDGIHNGTQISNSSAVYKSFSNYIIITPNEDGDEWVSLGTPHETFNVDTLDVAIHELTLVRKMLEYIGIQANVDNIRSILGDKFMVVDKPKSPSRAFSKTTVKYYTNTIREKFLFNSIQTVGSLSQIIVDTRTLNNNQTVNNGVNNYTHTISDGELNIIRTLPNNNTLEYTDTDFLTSSTIFYNRGTEGSLRNKWAIIKPVPDQRLSEGNISDNLNNYQFKTPYDNINYVTNFGGVGQNINQYLDGNHIRINQTGNYRMTINLTAEFDFTPEGVFETNKDESVLKLFGIGVLKRTGIADMTNVSDYITNLYLNNNLTGNINNIIDSDVLLCFKSLLRATGRIFPFDLKKENVTTNIFSSNGFTIFTNIDDKIVNANAIYNNRQLIIEYRAELGEIVEPVFMTFNPFDDQSQRLIVDYEIDKFEVTNELLNEEEELNDGTDNKLTHYLTGAQLPDIKIIDYLRKFITQNNLYTTVSNNNELTFYTSDQYFRLLSNYYELPNDKVDTQSQKIMKDTKNTFGFDINYVNNSIDIGEPIFQDLQYDNVQLTTSGTEFINTNDGRRFKQIFDRNCEVLPRISNIIFGNLITKYNNIIETNGEFIIEPNFREELNWSPRQLTYVHIPSINMAMTNTVGKEVGSVNDKAIQQPFPVDRVYLHDYNRVPSGSTRVSYDLPLVTLNNSLNQFDSDITSNYNLTLNAINYIGRVDEVLTKLYTDRFTLREGEIWELNVQLSSDLFTRLKVGDRLKYLYDTFIIINIDGFDPQGVNLTTLTLYRQYN